MTIFDEEELLEEEDEFTGFTVVDENAVYRLKSQKVEDEDQPTIASEIPENETKVLLDNPQILGADDGDEVTISGTEVLFSGSKLGSLKPAFLEKLILERAGQYAHITICDSNLFIIRLEFSPNKTDTHNYKIG